MYTNVANVAYWLHAAEDVKIDTVTVDLDFSFINANNVQAFTIITGFWSC